MTVLVLQPGDDLTVKVPSRDERKIRIVFCPIPDGNLDPKENALEFIGISGDDGLPIDLQECWTADGEYEALDLVIVQPSGQLAFPLNAPAMPFTSPPGKAEMQIQAQLDLITTRLTRDEFALITKYRQANKGIENG